MRPRGTYPTDEEAEGRLKSLLTICGLLVVTAAVLQFGILGAGAGTSGETDQATKTDSQALVETPLDGAMAAPSPGEVDRAFSTSRLGTDDAAPPPPANASGAPPARVVLPVVSVDAPVVLGEVDEVKRQMIAPTDPAVVAWYDFSPLPGTGGNAVFVGHVDYVGFGPAVFWDLRRLDVGDRIHVDLADGTRLTYEVSFNEVYPVESGPWGSLFAPDTGEGDVVTMYTCDGNLRNGQYDARRVVRALLVEPMGATG